MATTTGSRLRAFTLVELLAVMALGTILVSLVAPAYQNIEKEAALNNAGNKMEQMINFARQNSIAKNAVTALVLPTAPDISDHSRVVGVMELVPPVDGSAPTTSDWKLIQKWELLAPGVIADVVNWTPSTQSVSPAFPSLTYHNQPISADGYQYLLFMPNGSLSNSTASTLRLVKGYWDIGSISPRYTGPLNDGIPANYYTLTVLNKTGRVKIDRP